MGRGGNGNEGIVSGLFWHWCGDKDVGEIVLDPKRGDEDVVVLCIACGVEYGIELIEDDLVEFEGVDIESLPRIVVAKLEKEENVLLLIGP